MSRTILHKFQAAVLALLAVPAFAGNSTNYTYLALRGSIAYGLNVNLLPTSPTQPLPSPSQFTGYPEVLAQAENWFQSQKLVNASCPGETSGSSSPAQGRITVVTLPDLKGSLHSADG